MIHYNLVNEYFDDIELPKPMTEVVGASYELEGKELDFITQANNFLEHEPIFSSYQKKDVHCLGTCLINLTRTGLYFLLEDEIMVVHRSILKEGEGEADWEISHFRFTEIQNLDHEVINGLTEPKYESGALFLKVLNEKGAVRNHTLRNMNPGHFQCFEDFHVAIKNNRTISK